MPRPAKPFWKASHQAYYANISGKQTRLGTTWDEAEREFFRLKAEQSVRPADNKDAKKGRRRKPAVPTVNSVVDVCTKYLSNVQASRADRTFGWYRDVLRLFCKEVGKGLTVEELIPQHLTEWVNGHQEWKPTTRFNYISAVQRAFRWATRQRIIPANPIEFVDKPERESREVIVTNDNWKEILGSYPTSDPFRELLVFAWATGARPQESKAIQAKHIQHGGRVAVLEKRISKKKGKKRRNRVLYIPPDVRELVNKRCEQCPEGPIFRNRNGGPWTTNAIRSRFRRLREKLDIEGLFMYAIRHTWETNMLLEKPLQVVAELAGHDPKTAMENYNHPQFVLKEMLDRLDNEWKQTDG